MRRRGRVRMTVVVPVVMAFAGVAACGDDGGDGIEADGAALIEPFQAKVEDAYEAYGSDRSEDFNRGAIVEDGCFVLDQGAATAVADALGVEDPPSIQPRGNVFVSGPPEREILTCSIGDGDDVSVSVTAGTVPVDRDGLFDDLQERQEALGNEGELRQIDGDAPGLDAANVLAVEQDGGATFIWVDGGFVVSIHVPAEVAEPEGGFQALPTLVGAVAASLAAD